MRKDHLRLVLESRASQPSLLSCPLTSRRSGCCLTIQKGHCCRRTLATPAGKGEAPTLEVALVVAPVVLVLSSQRSSCCCWTQSLAPEVGKVERPRLEVVLAPEVLVLMPTKSNPRSGCCSTIQRGRCWNQSLAKAVGKVEAPMLEVVAQVVGLAVLAQMPTKSWHRCCRPGRPSSQNRGASRQHWHYDRSSVGRLDRSKTGRHERSAPLVVCCHRCALLLQSQHVDLCGQRL
jgi:hypothetical protein